MWFKKIISENKIIFILNILLQMVINYLISLLIKMKEVKQYY